MDTNNNNNAVTVRHSDEELSFLDSMLNILHRYQGRLEEREDCTGFINEIAELAYFKLDKPMQRYGMTDLEWAIECKDQDLLDEAIDELDDKELDEEISLLEEEKVEELKKLMPELFANEENHNER